MEDVPGVGKSTLAKGPREIDLARLEARDYAIVEDLKEMGVPVSGAM